MENLNSIKVASPWRAAPLKSRLIFLVAVFLFFSSCGIAFDVIDMGNQPPLQLALSVVFTATFSVAYAATGIALRGKFWKAFLPLFALHVLCMNLLGHWFPPEPPRPAQYSAAPAARLHARLTFDATAIMFCVVLGYIGTVVVSISESRRHIRAQAEKASLESEMAAAREIQRVMVPEDLPPVAGYAIHSVYRPAAEVGGDFLQLIPLPGGSTLVVIGDVSGKGLRAAMIVSMIIGMLLTITTYTQEPAEILAELNRRLCGRTHGGFATCLIVRLQDRGHIALANAGHPPPYLNAAEIPFAGSMPLGLADSVVYEQVGAQLAPGDIAMLLTDGIPEAQNQDRVLFGFPRIESLLRDRAGANALADAAQQFGQNDDITVISIARET
jgi:hypothetical protein